MAYHHCLLQVCLGALLVFSQACGLQLSRQQPVDPRIAQIDAESTRLPGETPPPLLAIEVEVAAQGVTPLSSSIVFAPMPANAAVPDLRVLATGGGQTLAAYSIIDPRLAEVDGEGTLVLDAARTFVHLPLSANADLVRLVPAREGEALSAGGSFDPRPWAQRACRKGPEVAACRRILSAAAPGSK